MGNYFRNSSTDQDLVSSKFGNKTVPIQGFASEIAKRWSPRIFQDKPIEPEKIDLLLNTAAWELLARMSSLSISIKSEYKSRYK